MRWLKLLVVTLILLSLGLPATPVEAATSDTVIIKCTGIVCEAPGGFTIIYISDYEIGLSWTKPLHAANTMIRAALGREPTDPAPGEEPTDGMLIYYGEDTYVTHWTNLETTSVPMYYKAWCQTASGAWSPLYSSGNVEGIGMVLIALIVLALGFSSLSYVFKRMELLFASAGGWFVLGIYSYTRSTSPSPTEITDIYMGLFWLCVALVITFAMLPIAMRQKPGILEPEAPESESEQMEKETEELEKEMMPFRFKTRRARERLSRFARKGEE